MPTILTPMLFPSSSKSKGDNGYWSKSNSSVSLPHLLKKISVKALAVLIKTQSIIVFEFPSTIKPKELSKWLFVV